MVEYKRTCQLLPSEPRPNPSSDKRAGHSSFEHRHQLGSHKTLTYSKLRRLLLRCDEGNDVSDSPSCVVLGSFLGAIRGCSKLRIDGEGVDMDEGASSSIREAKGMSQLQRLQLRLSANDQRARYKWDGSVRQPSPGLVRGRPQSFIPA